MIDGGSYLVTADSVLIPSFLCHLQNSFHKHLILWIIQTVWCCTRMPVTASRQIAAHSPRLCWQVRHVSVEFSSSSPKTIAKTNYGGKVFFPKIQVPGKKVKCYNTAHSRQSSTHSSTWTSSDHREPYQARALTVVVEQKGLLYNSINILITNGVKGRAPCCVEVCSYFVVEQPRCL